ncbi:hypothetical protein [Vibrio phage BUCT194]|uniref:Uncharacterized protein n=1 Tax=Vibrio phage BUCT194 TaxID=2859072 RepID=A0AAE9BQ07_9CAUD|nr:hypothetical protein PP741_gp035 [Vibrio phage BUCT194]UAW01190.1 hypothetical protein [Vibrio phage BUCT194]
MVLVQTYYDPRFNRVYANYLRRGVAHADTLYYLPSYKSLPNLIKLEKSNVHSYIEYRSEVHRRKQNLRRVR